MFDFSGGRSFRQVHAEHAYCQNPTRSASKSTYNNLPQPQLLVSPGHVFMLMHLSDAFFFVNELTKTQGTSETEADLYI